MTNVITKTGSFENIINGLSEQLIFCDVLFINPKLKHAIHTLSPEHQHRDLYVSPKVLKKICLDHFDEAFYTHLIDADHAIKIPLHKDEFIALANRAHQLEMHSHLHTDSQSHLVYKRCVMCMIVQLLGVYYHHMHYHHHDYPKWLSDFLITIQNPDLFSRPLKELIAISNYSRTHIERLFIQFFNQTFKDYITDLRINYAKELISLKGYSILEVSQYVGYNSLSHFIQQFKKYTNLTPLQYRQSLYSDTKKA